MQTFILTVISLLFSTLCLAVLVNTDPKRRRAYRLSNPPTWAQTHRRWLWLLTLLPSLLLIALNAFSALTLWTIGWCIFGWGMAVMPPKVSKPKQQNLSTKT